MPRPAMGCAAIDHDGHSATPDVPVCTGVRVEGRPGLRHRRRWRRGCGRRILAQWCGLEAHREFRYRQRIHPPRSWAMGTPSPACSSIVPRPGLDCSGLSATGGGYGTVGVREVSVTGLKPGKHRGWAGGEERRQHHRRAMWDGVGDKYGGNQRSRGTGREERRPQRQRQQHRLQLCGGVGNGSGVVAVLVGWRGTTTAASVPATRPVR